jgi:hypothetical protein
VLSGALSGRQLAGAAGIVPGALGAVAGTIRGYRARAGLAELTRLPAPVLGLTEDAAAVAAAALATRGDREQGIGASRSRTGAMTPRELQLSVDPDHGQTAPPRRGRLVDR